jgi:hypothetical protein
MRVSTTILSFVAATSVTLSPAFAQGHGASGKPPASVKSTSSGKPVTTTTHSTGKPTTSGKPVATTTRSAGKPTTTGKPVTTTTHSTGKPTTSGKPVATTTQVKGKPATTGKPTKTTSGKPTATTTTTTSSSGSTSKHTGSTTTTTTVSGTTATPLNPIAAKIASKPNLSTKINGMLPIDPVTGVKMTLDAASMGFKNQGQFIAALHVSQNLGISFTELKSHMVTVTPGVAGQPATATQTGSLGQAIQASKKTANVTTEVERAEAQASADLQSVNSTSTATTSGSTQTKKKNTTPPPTTTGRGGW